jgi:4-hydroxy-3-methylbut-2-enyl diphosphate reductase IspH
MSERLTHVAVRQTAEHYALPTSQEVEDEITEQRSIGVTAHVQSGAS